MDAFRDEEEVGKNAVQDILDESMAQLSLIEDKFDLAGENQSPDKDEVEKIFEEKYLSPKVLFFIKSVY